MTRFRLFVLMSVVALAVYGYMDYTETVVDRANPIMVYGYLAAVSLMCSMLYMWWWAKTGKASDVFQCVTFLMLSVFYDMSISAYARYLYSWHKECYEVFIGTSLWTSRMVPKSLAMTYMLALIIIRLWKGNGDNQ